MIITGGSVYTNGSFKGIGGTAWGNDAWSAEGYNPNDPDDPNKVFMVTIDLSADLRAAGESGDNLIESWNLKVGGEDYPYGAPTQLLDGKLYLWLPKSATKQTVSVDLSYRGKDGQPHPFDTLFRNPGQVDQLKRYEDFELPKEYLDGLVKPYDGRPFKTYEITPEHPLRTPEVLSRDEEGNPTEYRWLTNTDDVVYRYRLYDKRNGAPIGDEVDSGRDMPVNVGVMKFTMVSAGILGSSDPALADFRERLLGTPRHRLVRDHAHPLAGARRGSDVGRRGGCGPAARRQRASLEPAHYRERRHRARGDRGRQAPGRRPVERHGPHLQGAPRPRAAFRGRRAGGRAGGAALRHEARPERERADRRLGQSRARQRRYGQRRRGAQRIGRH